MFNLLVYILFQPACSLVETLTVDQALLLLSTVMSDDNYYPSVLLHQYLCDEEGGAGVCDRLQIVPGQALPGRTKAFIKGLLEEHAYPGVGTLRVQEPPAGWFRRRIEGVAAFARGMRGSQEPSDDALVLHRVLLQVSREHPDHYNFIVASLNEETAQQAPGTLSVVDALAIADSFIPRDDFLPQLLKAILDETLVKKLGIGTVVLPSQKAYLQAFFMDNEHAYVGTWRPRVG